MLFYDQVIPGSTLLAYVNADRRALARADRAHAHHRGRTVRHAERLPSRGAVEALLRYIDEELAKPAR